jgi:hypothetical protein
VDWTYLAQDRHTCRAVVITVMNLRVPVKYGAFLDCIGKRQLFRKDLVWWRYLRHSALIFWACTYICSHKNAGTVEAFYCMFRRVHEDRSYVHDNMSVKYLHMGQPVFNRTGAEIFLFTVKSMALPGAFSVFSLWEAYSCIFSVDANHVLLLKPRKYSQD